MTDNEKLDLILSRLEKLDIIESEMQNIKNNTQELKQKVSSLDEKVAGLEKDMTVVKSDLKQLQRDANFILDEVERVHGILDIHKADKSAHNSMTVIK